MQDTNEFFMERYAHEKQAEIIAAAERHRLASIARRHSRDQRRELQGSGRPPLPLRVGRVLALRMGSALIAVGLLLRSLGKG